MKKLILRMTSSRKYNMQQAVKRVVVMVMCGTMLLSGGLAMAKRDKGRGTGKKTEIVPTRLVPVPFYHLGGGNYSRNPGSGTNCEPPSDFPCQIIYDDAVDVEGINTFTYAGRPQFDRTETDPGVWQ